MEQENEQIFKSYNLTGYLGEKDAPTTGSYSPEKVVFKLNTKKHDPSTVD